MHYTTRQVYTMCRRACRELIKIQGPEACYAFVRKLATSSIRDALAGEFCGYR